MYNELITSDTAITPSLNHKEMPMTRSMNTLPSYTPRLIPQRPQADFDPCGVCWHHMEQPYMVAIESTLLTSLTVCENPVCRAEAETIRDLAEGRLEVVEA